MVKVSNKEIMSRNIVRYMDIECKTRKAIADDLGVAYMTVCDWANGTTYPKPDKIELLASYFKINKNDLIEDNMSEKMRKDDLAELTPIALAMSDETRASLLRIAKEML